MFVAGESVSDTALRKVWQDTTQAHTMWDRPIYEEFFREFTYKLDGTESVKPDGFNGLPDKSHLGRFHSRPPVGCLERGKRRRRAPGDLRSRQG
jgi:hypothetical protein